MLKNAESATSPALVKPSQQAPGAVAATDSNPLETQIHSLRRHPIAATLVCAITAAAGITAVMKTVKPIYYANSIVYVSPTFPRTLREDREHEYQYNNYVQQQMLTVPRFDLVLGTLRRLEAEGITVRLPGESEEQATEKLRKAIEVTHTTDSFQIAIGMHSKDPKHLDTIVGHLTEQLVRESRSEQSFGVDIRTTALNAEKARLQAELDKILQGEILDPAPSPGDSKVTAEDYTPAEESGSEQRRVAARARLEEARRARIEAEVQSETLERDPEVLKSLAATVAPSVPDTATLDRMDRQRQRRAELQSELARLGSAYPGYAAMRAEIEQIDAALSESAKQMREADTRRTAASMGQILAKARLDLSRAKAIEAALMREMESLGREAVKPVAKSGSVEMPKPRMRPEDLQKTTEPIRAQINAIDDRLAYFRVERDSPGFLRIVSPARRPSAPEKDNRKKYLAMVGAGAILAGLATSILLEILRRQIRSVGEIEKVLGFPPLAVMLRQTSENKDFADDYFDKLVNRVERIVRTRESSVIVFTAAGATGGDRSIILRIGNALQERGIRTIGFDANANIASRNTNAGGSRGAAAQTADGLITAESDVTASSFDRRFTVLHSLLGFARNLPEITRKYDAVLVDAPPLLVSANAEYLVTLSSITFLTVEAGVTTKNDLTRSAGLLQKLNPPGVGAIGHRFALDSYNPQLVNSFREYENSKTRFIAGQVPA
jgi:polysaccharide biosynthesis transport protein